MRLPWWLNPWREVWELEHRLDDMGETAQMDIATIRHLEDELENIRAKLRSALAGNLHTATASQHPEFVLVGIERGPGLGKRLIAARELPGAELGMTAIDDPPPRWQIRATLDRPLFIDGPDYATALDRMRAIWANWDKAATGGLPVEPPARGAIGS